MSQASWSNNLESSFYKDDESNKEAWAFGKNMHHNNEFGLGFALNQ